MLRKKTDQIYLYNNLENKLLITDYNILNTKIEEIEIGKFLNINIDVNYIYINPDYFLSMKYQFSKSQSDTKNKINDYNGESSLLIVTGRAGTGKTLLSLDIYKILSCFDIFIILLLKLMSFYCKPRSLPFRR